MLTIYVDTAQELHVHQSTHWNGHTWCYIVHAAHWSSTPCTPQERLVYIYTWTADNTLLTLAFVAYSESDKHCG